MICFNAATLEVKDPNVSITMSALKQGFWNGRLSFFLDINFSKNYVDLLVHAGKYTQVEEIHFLSPEGGRKESGKKWGHEEETRFQREATKSPKSLKPNQLAR